MNTRELIVGHFEGTLTAADQSRLDHLLETSAEARADFERHQLIEDGLAEDSRNLVPPIGLREATLAAAFSGAASTIGGGITAWFTAKVAVMVGTVAVGGLVVGGLLMNDGDDPKPSDNVTPVVQVEESEQSGGEPINAQEVEPLTDAPEVTSRPTPQPAVERTRPRATNASTSDTREESQAADGNEKPSDEIEFGREPAATVVTDSIQIDSGKRKN